MNFEIPTTKQELTDTLREIDEYYRYRKDFYEEPVLLPLELERIEFTALSDEEITLAVNQLFLKKKNYEKLQKQTELNAEILVLQAEKSAVADVEEKLAEIDAAYDESVKKLEAEVAERNMSYSSAYYKALAELEEKRNSKKSAVSDDVKNKQAVIDGKIAAKQLELDGLDATLTPKYEALIAENVRERKDKQREYADTVLKYNNQVDEKIIKHKNSINQNYTKLKIDYMAIVNKGLTTEQLDALGYYGDVITAVDGYYYSISATDAYDDFSKDVKMPYYLGEYYNDILYKYKLRANQ